jgi:hypothetical protein
MFSADAARLPWRQYLEKWRVRHDASLERGASLFCSTFFSQAQARILTLSLREKLISDACRASEKLLNHAMQERLPVSNPLDGALSTVWAKVLGPQGRGEYPQVPAPRVASTLSTPSPLPLSPRACTRCFPAGRGNICYCAAAQGVRGRICGGSEGAGVWNTRMLGRQPEMVERAW